MSLQRIVINLSGCLLAIFPFYTSTGQTTPADSSFYTAAISSAVERYHAASGDQSRLYNGSQYGGYQFTFKSGSPYFSALSFTKGSIVYDGVFFKDVSLLYDQVRDVVVMQDAGHHIQLVSEKVSGFTIGEYSFQRIVKDSMSQPLVSTGIYQQLYAGNITILKKELKSVQEEITSIDGLQRFIDQKNHYYLKKGDTYYSVRKKDALLDVLSDKRKELQQFIKKNKLNFRKDRDNMLVKVAAYYDQLTR